MRRKITAILFCLITLFSVHFAYAQDDFDLGDAQVEAPKRFAPFGSLLQRAANTAGYNTSADEGFLIPALGAIVFWLLSLLGVLFLLLTIYGGLRWMMARGNEEEVKRGRDIIKHALTGLVIVAGAFGIWKVIEQILL